MNNSISKVLSFTIVSLLVACDTQVPAPVEESLNASFEVDGERREAKGTSFRYNGYDTIALTADRERRQYFAYFNFDSLAAGTYDMSWTDPNRGAYYGFVLSELVDDAVYGEFLLREGSPTNRVVVEETADGYAVQFNLSLGVEEPRDPITLSGSHLPDSFTIRNGRIDLVCGPEVCE